MISSSYLGQGGDLLAYRGRLAGLVEAAFLLLVRPFGKDDDIGQW